MAWAPNLSSGSSAVVRDWTPIVHLDFILGIWPGAADLVAFLRCRHIKNNQEHPRVPNLPNPRATLPLIRFGGFWQTGASCMMPVSLIHWFCRATIWMTGFDVSAPARMTAVPVDFKRFLLAGLRGWPSDARQPAGVLSGGPSASFRAGFSRWLRPDRFCPRLCSWRLRTWPACRPCGGLSGPPRCVGSFRR